MKKLISLVLALVMLVAMAAVGGVAEGFADSYDITVWVPEEIKELTAQQIDTFNNTNQFGIKFNPTIEAVSEAVAADNMVNDVEAGGDIFCFPQDQFARLLRAKALDELTEVFAEKVAAENDANSIAAAKSGDVFYAYPLTSDNGYFMYYDKSVIPEEDIDSLEALIADCEAAQKYFAFELQTSSWYLASFFFGTGCVSEWVTDDDGTFVKVRDTFNSPEGLIAAKGIEKLVKSPFHLSSSKADSFESNAAIVVTGIWDYELAKQILGDNLGVADLPSFTVDGEEYHIGSFKGSKLMGVKPGNDVYRQAAMHFLAQYLTSEECQLQRFELKGWGPSNLADQELDAVKNHPGLAALKAQDPYSVPQGQIHGSWWGIAQVIADDIKLATDEAGLQAALDKYLDKINELFTLDNTALLFVGAWNGWNNADTSKTYYLAPKADGSYVLTLDVPESGYMGGRVVNPGSWDTDKGFAQVTEGADLIKDLGADNPDNNIVFAEPGNYTITWDGEAFTIVKN
ncbi:MAG: extracellular solute-binding protein [Clostridiales bacterium]|nr:extracellular solute-binding protein [Clostridiales bacterium]